jgi:hypothetical protein
MKIETRQMAGSPAVQIFSSEMGSAAVVKNSPYSGEAVTETVQTLADGNKITRKNTVTQYRDSEGRTRREFEFQWFGKLGDAEGGTSKSVSIDDPVAKFHYSLDLKNKTAEKMPTGEGIFTMGMPPPPPGAPMVGMVSGSAGAGVTHVFERSPMPAGAAAGNISFAATTATAAMPMSSAQAAKEDDLGSRNIEGVVAKGTRSTVTIPAGEVGNEREISVVTEKWYSDQLKTYVLTKHSDPRFGETTHKLTNVRLSEPPVTLFEVPADFMVREPQMRMPMIKKRLQE